MKIAFTYITLLTVLFVFSCKKIDKNKPLVESLVVNGLTGDTLLLSSTEIYLEYEITDDELVVESRVRMIENTNPDSGFFHLNIRTANAAYYQGSDKIFMPDSVLTDSSYYTLSIDAYDPSGNEAEQKKTLIHFN